MSIRAIDVGFDLRTAKTPIDLAKWPNLTHMPYDAADGTAAIATGTRDEIARTLRAAGYVVVTTPDTISTQ